MLAKEFALDFELLRNDMVSTPAAKSLRASKFFFASHDERHFRVLTEGHQFLFAFIPVFPAP